MLLASGDYTITEITESPMVLCSGQKIAGFRLELAFHVTDEDIPPFHWAGNAVQLSDTLALRQQLAVAYRDLHGLVSNGDAEAIFEVAEHVWARTAFILTSQPNASAFIEASDLGLAGRFGAVRSDGAKLQPLDLQANLGNAALQFMADRRLVRFRPDPIFWEKLPEGSGNRSSFPVVFYKGKDGSWHLAAIISGL